MPAGGFHFFEGQKNETKKPFGKFMYPTANPTRAQFPQGLRQQHGHSCASAEFSTHRTSYKVTLTITH